jgi:hypothetical protein
LLACAATATWIDLGSLHRFENADSLIPILVSLYRWTPFFWEQDRYGMLVPLLTTWIQHPLVNLLVQDGLTTFAWLTATVLLARYLLPNRIYALVAMLGIVALLLWAPPWQCFLLLVNTCYGVALALGLTGLLLLDRAGASLSPRRILLASLLLVLSHWVYCAVTLVLAPLLIARASLARPKDTNPGVVRSLTLVVAACMVGLLLTRLAPAAHTAFHLLPVGEWPTGWIALARHFWTAFAPDGWPIGLGLAGIAGLVVGWLAGARAGVAPACRAALALVAAGLPNALFMGTQEHARLNNFDVRYLFPSLFVWQGALAVLTIGPCSAFLRGRLLRVLHALAVAALFLAVAQSYGWPGLARVRADLDKTLGDRTVDVLAGNCTHILGRYWQVWATVYHANLVLYERGENRRVWGVAERCAPTRWQWRPAADRELRVAVAVDGEPQAGYFLAHYGFPALALVERRGTVWVFERRGATSQASVCRGRRF